MADWFWLMITFTSSLSLVLSDDSSIPADHLHKQRSKCDVYRGTWVHDKSYPLYDSLSCPFIRGQYDCKKFHRPDHDYLKYRWQPSGCNLPRFDADAFLNKLRGKKMMLVGDSVTANQFDSLICMLHTSLNSTSFRMLGTRNGVMAIFKDYEVEISLFTSHYLVDIEKEESGRILKLDSIKSGSIWEKMDVLMFNTWLWWGRRGPGQPWDLIEYNGKTVKDMNRVTAFEIGLKTWVKWVNSVLDTNKTQLMFLGIPPTHYNASEWNDPAASGCSKETEPLKGSTYPAGLPVAQRLLVKELKMVEKPVHLVDITTLSQLRKDGHPSAYNSFRGMDCTHWCLPGLPDTWNLLLYSHLVDKLG